jgi:hypothetical protein
MFGTHGCGPRGRRGAWGGGWGFDPAGGGFWGGQGGGSGAAAPGPGAGGCSATAT